jgi:cytochrome c-type biogenesis protein CcmH/NrfG
MKLKARVLGLLLLSALTAPAVHAQINGLYTDGMGAAKDPVQKAAASYSRGIQLKRKADTATDPAKKAKLYEKAKKELEKSAGYSVNFDAYLALGQIYLAMGDGHAALTSCAHAQSLKSDSAEARSCIDGARTMDQKANQKPEETPVPASSPS